MFLLLCVDAKKTIELEPSLVSVNLTGTQLGLCQFDRLAVNLTEGQLSLNPFNWNPAWSPSI
jgi:hypothetical protein